MSSNETCIENNTENINIDILDIDNRKQFIKISEDVKLYVNQEKRMRAHVKKVVI